MNDAVNRRWADFEALGETAVRQNLSSHVYGEENVKLANGWLAHKSEEAVRAAAMEQMAIARAANVAAQTSAKAAVDSADAAKSQALISKIALGISLLAIFVTVVGLVIQFS